MDGLAKKRNMLNVGITGGIGSGKSTVCKVFETLGIPVYYADIRGKLLMTESEEVKNAVIKLLGPASYEESGILNRAFVAEKVFNDESLLNQLNQIVHPAVRKDSEAWQRRQKNVPYTVKEAALLFESGSYKSLDYIITVHAPEDVCIQRVMARDQVTEAQVRARMDKQLPANYKRDHADFVVLNDGIKHLIPQVLEIHRHLSYISLRHR